MRTSFFFAVSCGELTTANSATVSIQIPLEQMEEAAFAHAAAPFELDDKVYTVEATLFVDGAQKKKSVRGTPMQISKKQIVFASVLIGSQISAAVEIKLDGNLVWSGESEAITLVAGKNSLSIQMSDPNNVHPRILKNGQSFRNSIPNKENITKIVFGLLNDQTIKNAIAAVTAKIDVGTMANTNHAYIVDTILYIVPDNPRAETIVLNPDCYRMFMDFTNCESIEGLELVDTSNVTDMSFLFYNCSALESLDLSSFNTAKVTTMYAMFYNCKALSSLDLSSFDTVKVENMKSMFSGCERLNTLTFGSGFDTSNVTDMSFMFQKCEGLRTLAFGDNFNTANVTTMENMFNSCSALSSLDLSSFNTAKVTTMYAMFNNCSALSSLDLSSFDTSNVTDMSFMFYGCGTLTIYVQDKNTFVPTGCESENMLGSNCILSVKP